MKRLICIKDVPLIGDKKQFFVGDIGYCFDIEFKNDHFVYFRKDKIRTDKGYGWLFHISNGYNIDEYFVLDRKLKLKRLLDK